MLTELLKRTIPYQNESYEKIQLLSLQESYISNRSLRLKSYIHTLTSNLKNYRRTTTDRYLFSDCLGMKFEKCRVSVLTHRWNYLQEHGTHNSRQSLTDRIALFIVKSWLSPNLLFASRRNLVGDVREKPQLVAGVSYTRLTYSYITHMPCNCLFVFGAAFRNSKRRMPNVFGYAPINRAFCPMRFVLYRYLSGLIASLMPFEF